MRGLVCGSLLLACALPGLDAAATDPSPVLEPGARLTVLSPIKGHRPEELPATYLGTHEDFAGPGYDLHLIELLGPTAERVGVANGMSGSPVYVDGRLVGALSHRMGRFPKSPIAGVTPIADMLSVGLPFGASVAVTDTDISPIATPILVGALRAPVRQWLTERFEGLGFVAIGAGGGPSGGSAPPLVPGAPVGVELVRGDLRIGATGTVTHIDGDTVYAFGHPFLGTGRVEMPMATAEVIHTLADYSGGTALARLGPTVGTIVEDRQSAIVGRLGREARMTRMGLRIEGGDYESRKLSFELARHPQLLPLLAASVTASSLISTNGYDRESTMLMRGAARLKGLPDLPIEMAFAGTGEVDPAIALASNLYATLNQLWSNPFEPVEIETLDLEVEVRPEVQSYRVESVHYDHGSLLPGEKLRLTCLLRAYRGELVTRELELALPERLPRKGSVVVAVGDPRGIDLVLGAPLEQRAETASDLTAFVRALADRRSAHRLTAVAYREGGGVVSRGVAYSDLPPTAAKLLGLQSSATPSKRQAVSPLGRAELELDGPVVGGVQVRLRIDRGIENGEGEAEELVAEGAVE